MGGAVGLALSCVRRVADVRRTMVVIAGRATALDHQRAETAGEMCVRRVRLLS